MELCDMSEQHAHRSRRSPTHIQIVLPSQTSTPVLLQVRQSHRRRSFVLPVAIILLVQLLCVPQIPVNGADITLFCKCQCPPNVTILTVPRCGECTKALCVTANACFMPPPAPSGNASLSTTIHRRQVVETSLTTSSDSSTPATSDTIDSTPTPTSTTTSFSFSTLTQPIETLTAVPKKSVAPDDDWEVTCFQRGSYKDEIIVYIFLVLVAVLLLWAAVRPHADSVLSSVLGARNPLLQTSRRRRGRTRQDGFGDMFGRGSSSGLNRLDGVEDEGTEDEDYEEAGTEGVYSSSEVGRGGGGAR
ncbi:hypothetical protein DFJ73DRAFT_817598 [Zopfochytrium polystomum]|nr:hypothetical protein DFJ73DRAFT_817598 [Zopfochytrium polystomum]